MTPFHSQHATLINDVSTALHFEPLSSATAAQSYPAVESPLQLQWPAEVDYGYRGPSGDTELEWSQRPYRNGLHEHGWSVDN